MTKMIRTLLPIAMAAVLFGCQTPATDDPIQPHARESPSPDEQVDPTTANPTPAVDDPTPAVGEPSWGGSKPANDGNDPTQPDAEPIAGTMSDGTAVPLVPSHPDAFIRVRRRMDIGQLSDAIKRATDGIGWFNEGAWWCSPRYKQKPCVKGTDLFQKLSATLGVPDYIVSVTEERDAGPVFQKFVGDAARSVCTKLVDAELKKAPEDRVLMVHATPTDTIASAPDAIYKNLGLLLLRYHGVKVTGPADPAIQRWHWLFQTIVKGTDQPVQGWRAVCIGLIQHPDFYSY